MLNYCKNIYIVIGMTDTNIGKNDMDSGDEYMITRKLSDFTELDNRKTYTIKVIRRAFKKMLRYNPDYKKRKDYGRLVKKARNTILTDELINDIIKNNIYDPLYNLVKYSDIISDVKIEKLIINL